MTVSSAQFKTARQLLKWSQSKLAGEAGVSASTIGHIEAGTRRAPAPTFFTIRRGLEDAGVDFAERKPKLRKAK